MVIDIGAYSVWVEKILIEDLGKTLFDDCSGARNESGRSLDVCGNGYLRFHLCRLGVHNDPARVLKALPSGISLGKIFCLHEDSP